MCAWVDSLFPPQVVPAIAAQMQTGATLLTLIKPQFEARRDQVKRDDWAGVVILVETRTTEPPLEAGFGFRV